MLSLWWKTKPQIFLRLIVCKIIKRDTENFSKLLAFVKVGNTFAGFPFGNGLSCNAKFFRNIFLSQL